MGGRRDFPCFQKDVRHTYVCVLSGGENICFSENFVNVLNPKLVITSCSLHPHLIKHYSSYTFFE